MVVAGGPSKASVPPVRRTISEVVEGGPRGIGAEWRLVESLGLVRVSHYIKKLIKGITYFVSSDPDLLDRFLESLVPRWLPTETEVEAPGAFVPNPSKFVSGDVNKGVWPLCECGSERGLLRYGL